MNSLFNVAGRRRASFVGVALLLALTVSGCIGGKDAGKQNLVVDTSGAPIVTTSGPIPTESLAINDPKRHFHHYWGDRTEVTIFEDQLELEQDPFRGSEFGCRSVGHKEFNLEDDGDDSDGKPTSPPVNPDSGRADTVFAGADHITATLVDQDPNIVGNLYLRWKPANLNFYKPENGCGVLMKKGESLTIPVGRGASDPAHQFAVSRWSFFVMAAQEQGDQYVPTVGRGTFSMMLSAHNGGENALDPAHPDLYGDGLTYDLGCHKEESVSQQLVVWAVNPARKATLPIHRPPAEPLREIKLEYGRIVPLLTEKVTITFTAQYSGPVSGTTAELYYFGADTNRYAPVPRLDGDAYEVVDPDQLKADPPYEDESLWRFMIVPRPPGGVQHLPDPQATDGSTYDFSAADFQGSYEICAVAHKLPTAVLT